MKKKRTAQAAGILAVGKRTAPQSQNNLKKQEPLAKYFPNIRTRREVLKLIHSNKGLINIFYQWSEKEQEDFLDFCTGARGVKMLYDGFFKEVFNPEATPKRLEELLSLLMQRSLKIKQVLPNDSVRLGAESSLLYTDIIVQLEDDSLANVEIQKIGYGFPGERCACYSADHLLRQYKRVRGEQGKTFSYRNIKNVYTIVFFEQSPKEFHKYPTEWLHRFHQQSNTGLVLELLQEYYFVPLDIFRKTMENKGIGNELEAWLCFLSSDEPERIEELIIQYPKFKAMYEDIYEMCRNMEEVMSMYSKELQELDHNTVLYMIDEMQERLNRQDVQLEQKDVQLEQKDVQLEQKDVQLRQKDAQLEQLTKLVQQLQGQILDLQKKE